MSCTVILLTLISIAALTIAAYLTIIEYRPPPHHEIYIAPGLARSPGPTLKLLSWNIGYAALDAANDFFADGGINSRARSKQAVEDNLASITDKLTELDADVMFLQEVDRRADRSFGVRQLDALRRAFSSFNRSYAENYRVPYVPIPLRRPLGSVASGLLTLSRPAPLMAERLALPSEYFWPRRIFYPRRCLLVNYFPLPDNRRLLLINLHLSAFDPGGILRRRQLRLIKKLMLEETGKGNTVILGGDFNNNLPGTPVPQPSSDKDDISWLISLPEDWTPPGWTWAADRTTPSVRTLGSPLAAGRAHFAHIDGFLLSPGIGLKSVRAIDLGFTSSDHNPVLVEVAVKGFTSHTD